MIALDRRFMKAKTFIAGVTWLMCSLFALSLTGCGGGNARDQDGYFLQPVSSPSPSVPAAATGE
jgi:hypothetical protein